MEKGTKILIICLAVGGVILLAIGAVLLLLLIFVLPWFTLKINMKKPATSNPPVAVGEFKGFDYTPGYSDMDGASIHESLMKNENGEWIIERRARSDYESPMIVTTYLVKDEDVQDFADFIKDKNICGLEDRPDSDLFITDYTAWSYGIEFDNSSIGGDAWQYYSIDEYKEYSDEDEALLDALDQKFEDLHYNMISQIEEEE